MSRQIINQILGEATVDPDFCHQLLTFPLETIAARGWILSKEERNVIETIKACDLAEFCQILLEHLPLDCD
jgi:hypothetical protein